MLTSRSTRSRLALAVSASALLLTAGRGEQNPIADNATKAGQALNRRVEIRVG